MSIIKAYNIDLFEIIKSIGNESIDVLLIDPPYLYLKNQKLDVPFDEKIFFEESKRIIKTGGFIILFGRGPSFYRWNMIILGLGFTFKEEIIWDKKETSSAVLSINRIHETISIFSKGNAKINKIKIPYQEIRNCDIPRAIRDIKELRIVINNNEFLNILNDFLETGNHKMIYDIKEGITMSGKSLKKPPTCVTIANYIKNGFTTKSIISQSRDRYNRIHPTQKPIRLLEILLLLTCNKEQKNTLVADFFGGSMSAMIAALNLGFNGISCEIQKEYYDNAIDKIKKIINQNNDFFTENILITEYFTSGEATDSTTLK